MAGTMLHVHIPGVSYMHTLTNHLTKDPVPINGPPAFTVLTTRAWYKILMMDSQQINGCASLQISEVHGTGSNMRRRPIASNKQCKCKVENELTITMAYKTIHTHCGN